MKIFQIPEKTLFKFLNVLEDNYLADVPYHNSLHAADTVQTIHILSTSPSFKVSGN